MPVASVMNLFATVISVSFVISTLCSSAAAEFKLISLVYFIVLEPYAISLLLCWLAGLKKKWVESGFRMFKSFFLSQRRTHNVTLIALVIGPLS